MITKKGKIFVVALVCAMTSVGEFAAREPRRFVIALGAGLPKDKGNELLKRTFQLLLSEAKAGDRVEIISAPFLTTLADVVVPPGSPRERVNSSAFAGRFEVLQAFVNTAPVDLRLAGQLRLPQLLDEVAHRRQTGKAVILILVGSPIFMTTNATESAFNMDEGLVPGDGLIIASSAMSLFGTKERAKQLEGVTVHWFVPNENWGLGEIQRGMVLRFWSAFIQSQSGVLASFGSDVGNVFDRAVSEETRPVMIVTLNPDRELAMKAAPVFRREVQSPALPLSIREVEPPGGKLAIAGSAGSGSVTGQVSRAAGTNSTTQESTMKTPAQEPASPDQRVTNRKTNSVEKLNAVNADIGPKGSKEGSNHRLAGSPTLEPAALPVGSRASVVEIATNDLRKEFTIDLLVEDAQGRAIGTLVARDFRVSIAGRPAAGIQVSQFRKPPTAMHIVLAIDRSSSMAGAPFDAAIKAAQELILGLRTGGRGTFVKVLAFSDHTEVLCDWTENMRAAALALEKQKAIGATALFEVIETALAELGNHEGNKRLVVFTDGRNTKSWTRDIGHLTSRFQMSSIPIISIGLRTRELDAKTLQMLAENTGGMYVEAASVRDIAPSFRTGGQALQKVLYRLVVTPRAGLALGDAPLQISIGGTNGVVLNHGLVSPTASKEGKLGNPSK